MTNSNRSVLSLTTNDGLLRLDFQWQADRFVQRFFVDDAEVGKSIEGDTEDPWPCSPPLQQLSREHINEANVILGVGAAGRGHWSISVEIDQEVTSAFKFDLACRCPEPPDFLGSQYQLADNLTLQALTGGIQVQREAALVTAAVPLKLADTYRWSYRISQAN